MIKNPRVISALLIALTLGVILSFVWPEYENIQAIRAAHNDRILLKNQFIDAQQKIAELSNVYAFNQDALLLFERTMPQTKEVEYIVSGIDSMVTETGMHLSTVTVDSGAASTDASGASFVSVKIGVSGQFEQFLNLLLTIEKSARMYDVRNMDIRPKSDRSQEVIVSLTLSTYFLAPASEKPVSVAPVVGAISQ